MIHRQNPQLEGVVITIGHDQQVTWMRLSLRLEIDMPISLATNDDPPIRITRERSRLARATQ